MKRKEIDFTVFCIESVAEHLNMIGSDVYALLNGNNRILDNYIIKSYDVLHTQGKDYIVNDIVEYMRKERLIK